jgi:hypothetical protein
MRAVLADLALDWPRGRHADLGWSVAAAFDDPAERGPMPASPWRWPSSCRTSARRRMMAEAMECLGGMGYVEDTGRCRCSTARPAERDLGRVGQRHLPRHPAHAGPRTRSSAVDAVRRRPRRRRGRAGRTVVALVGVAPIAARPVGLVHHQPVGVRARNSAQPSIQVGSCTRRRPSSRPRSPRPPPAATSFRSRGRTSPCPNAAACPRRRRSARPVHASVEGPCRNCRAGRR